MYSHKIKNNVLEANDLLHAEANSLNRANLNVK